MENSLVKELNEFLKWFKENHPELHEKYSRNIKIPMMIGGGVGVSNDFKISDEEHKMLLKVANQYYNQS